MPPQVKITSPDKVLFPSSRITKRELIAYYEEICPRMLPFIKDRPVSLVRSPHGVGGEEFYQKHPTENFPDYIDRVKIKEASGKSGIYISLDEPADLIYLSNISVIEYHVWGSTIDDLEHPDTMVFDLDPSPGTKWEYTIDAARLLREVLEDYGLQSFVKTSGKKGLHLLIPLNRKNDWEEVRRFSESLAKDLAARHPEELTTEFYKDKRGKRVFIDWLRNGRGATAAAAYSVRAEEAAPVSTPIAWEEVKDSLRPDQYNIRNIFKRLAALKNDPWEEYFKLKQNLPTDWKNQS